MCQNAKSHGVSVELLPSLLLDFTTRDIRVETQEYTDEIDIDLPGMIIGTRPWQKIMIGTLRLAVPCEDVMSLLDRLAACKQRRFLDGKRYYKLHAFHKCLVLTPGQRLELLAGWKAARAEAIAAARKHDDEYEAKYERERLAGKVLFVPKGRN